uniref:Uncharacterized protein n=1 Tax=Cannabis sativa TaxID=3483 RepID=A0A803Q221_CANSA
MAVPARKNAAGGFYYLGTHSSKPKIIVDLPNKVFFKDNFFWTSGLSPVSTTTFRRLPLLTRPTTTPKMVSRHRRLMTLPYGLRSCDFLLNEANLDRWAFFRKRSVLVIISFPSIHLSSRIAPKYDSWYRIFHIQINCHESYYCIVEQYGTMADRESHIDASYILEPIEPFDIFKITGCRDLVVITVLLPLLPVIAHPLATLREKGKKRVSNPGVPTTAEVAPPKRHRKTPTHKMKSLSEPIDLEVSNTETQEKVPPLVVPNTNAPPIKTARASASSSWIIEPLSAATGEARFEFAQAYGVACWRKILALLPPGWDLIHLGSREDMLLKRLDYNIMQEITHLRQEAEKAKEEAKNTIKAQADEFEKLAEKEVKMRGRCKKVGLRTVYRAWMLDPNMDKSFLEEKEEETLAFCEKSRPKEEEANVQEEEEDPSKSPTM